MVHCVYTYLSGCVKETDACDSCRNKQDGPYCVAECPESTYPDDWDRCQPCNANCVGGCTGPNPGIGDGACRTCDVVVNNGSASFCLSSDSECPENFYTRNTRDPETRHRYSVSVKLVCVISFSLYLLYQMWNLWQRVGVEGTMPLLSGVWKGCSGTGGGEGPKEDRLAGV